MNPQAVLCALLVLSQAMKDSLNFPKTDNAELRELVMDVLRAINARDPSGVQRCLEMYKYNRNFIHDLEDQSPLIIDPDIQTWSEGEIEKKRREVSHEQSMHEKLMIPQEAVTIPKKREQRKVVKGIITKDNRRSNTLDSPINTNPDTETWTPEKTAKKYWKHHVQDRSEELIHHNSAKTGKDKNKSLPNGEMTKNNRPAYTLERNKDLHSPKMTFSELAPHQDSPNSHDTCTLNLHFARDSNTLGSTRFSTSKSDDFPQELPIQNSPWNSDTTTDMCCDENPYDPINRATTNRQGYNPTQGHKALNASPVGPQYSSSARIQDFRRKEEGGDETVSIDPQHQKMVEGDQMGDMEKLDISSTNRAKQMDGYKQQYGFYGMCPEYFSRGGLHRREEERDIDNFYDMLLSVYSNYVSDAF